MNSSKIEVLLWEVYEEIEVKTDVLKLALELTQIFNEVPI